ncbi:hypothetical protein CIHG_06981 [Coccidioides immitis H538.4]|uniref:Uncharacterized protein n=3 Tax=Coccidioides immitis TaxID=5501 RepID=A0A0J8R0I5_COCIT|nr:hypothetical protein CIRG_10026 [Coccidioides immitis RMSCC 2394]KMU77153.1 hypothetical protein CISG_06190 [Coccidioides immitis RMSCC 3703]KMU89308.1 hypothetical protein CIHG_06981 [Coccidioides immitis H538.4]
MKGCIIHNQDRPRLRPSTAVMQKFFNKVLKDQGISRALENTRRNNTILGICRQYLIPSVTMKFGDLSKCYSKRRPTSPSGADSFITP